eukprot:TRINITY_DN31355_c0_g1_i1.p1 TRINITY_DN31355_c0_g1~~TRINITY_DN31355_c0_g1_i1.p1  ORF type:complete len:204 (+),score=48.62 TRINITY_DN31355_c0_g1_i1:56-667(+)
MAAQPRWSELTLASPKTALVSEGRKKVHSVYTDGTEMVEEFDCITDQLQVRKWRKPGVLGGEGEWVFEVGDDRPEVRRAQASDLLRPSATQPILSRKDTPTHFEWRIRNMPYPKENYRLTVEADQIVVRTENRKYFKRLDIPDMRRAGLQLEGSELGWQHAHATLVVQYKKPAKMVEVEKAAAKERASMKVERPGDEQGCAQQ